VRKTKWEPRKQEKDGGKLDEKNGVCVLKSGIATDNDGFALFEENSWMT
jgi:hypothetical protein